MMKTGNTLQRTYALGVCVLGALGCWIMAAGAETKATPVAPPAPAGTHDFRPCHPPGADMSPDGTWFVSLHPAPPAAGLLALAPAQSHRPVPLPKPPADAVFVDPTRVVVSFGPGGELAVLDAPQATVGAPFRVGASAGALCGLPGGRVVVLDAQQRRLLVVDPEARTVVHTRPVPPKAAQLGWAVPELTLDVADAQGKRLGTVGLPQPAPRAERGTP